VGQTTATTNVLWISNWRDVTCVWRAGEQAADATAYTAASGGQTSSGTYQKSINAYSREEHSANFHPDPI